MPAKVDLHIHSRYSDRSVEWLFRRLDFPDSYSDPGTLYRQLRERGMDFVTLTDHNRIEGCLEIADLPGTFVSEQVRAHFPGDKCEVHILVWGINEQQHREIAKLRENIFELQKFLAAQQIAHAVAHPLYNVNGKLTARHVEQLLLLFKHFEVINGLRDALLSELAGTLLGELTPEKIAEFAGRNNLDPTHTEPWKKIAVGGSDDHSGLYAASAWTEAEAGSPRDFLAQVRRGNCTAHGTGGTPLALSHGLYNTVFQFTRDKFAKTIGDESSLLQKMFSRFMEGRNPTEFTLTEKLGFLTNGIATGQIFELVKPSHASLWKELADYFKESDFSALLARETAGIAEPERRAFVIATLAGNQLAFRFFTKFIRQVSSGNLIESMQAASAVVPVLLLLSPYIYSFHSQAPSRKWLREVSASLTDEVPKPLRNDKRAWFTDTLDDVNGVATTIRKMTAAGVAAGKDIVVVTSRAQLEMDDIPIKNFPPIGEFELPEYELQKLAFPPVLQILDYIQREKFSEVIISTPGPIGLCALMAARILNLQTSGIYHTDFPQYVRMLTEDSWLETLTWQFMHWFYAQLDLVYVNSEQYRLAWIERGIPAERLKILPRGLDTALFHPSQRQADFWQCRGAEPGELALLYVGRVSKEKDLDLLAAAYDYLQSEGQAVRLCVVGNGPYLTQFKRLAPDGCYTGYLKGRELATAYASSDILVFPSTTDTFGNVVIEAQAAGLPAVVSDRGGPRELVEDGVTGFITRAGDVTAFTDAVRTLIGDTDLRRRMGGEAHYRVQSRNWSGAFETFWANSDIVRFPSNVASVP